jgi:release factor glutamine methyltransferase
MTPGQALDKASARLSEPTARLDAETLLRHVLKLSRTELYRRLDRELDDADAKTYFELIDRLATGEPLQYLTGHIEFYGLDVYVNSSVLIPRPETELLVEKALEIGRTYAAPVIADVGCGSGAVAVTLAKHLPRPTVLALDISRDALDLARRNAARHGCSNIEFIESDLLEGVGDRHLDIVCVNLPYVPTAEAKTNRFEPQLALDGGADGLDIIRHLVRQIAERREKPGWLLLEFGTGQVTAVKAILDENLPGSRTDILRDLIPLDRVSVTRLASI